MSRSGKRKAQKHAETMANIEAGAKIVRERVPKSRILAFADPDDQFQEVQTVNVRTTPVAWGLPMDETVFSMWVQRSMRHQVMPWDDLLFSRSTYVPDARNIIHDRFIKHSKCDILVMNDSDTILPPEFLDTCLNHMVSNPEIRMIGGWYKKKALEEGKDYPLVYHYRPDVPGKSAFEPYKEPGTGLESVDAAGAGCWVMHRSVAEAVGPMPYNMNEGGEDLIFCRKVVNAGFKLWIDWDLRCAHIGVAPY